MFTLILYFLYICEKSLRIYFTHICDCTVFTECKEHFGVVWCFPPAPRHGRVGGSFWALVPAESPEHLKLMSLA